ncbi:MAG: formylmethanofuran dehydrogenase subunit E family protein [Desulfobacteraceae bacterium]|nr:formylmethanofuran dehydrogenase subunit E family protein [Desulfobacteraceae bacterium]
MPDFETLLQGSAQEHGHLCAGQVIGVRMAMLGLKLIGLENPRAGRDIKKLIVYVEIDRCATDAIAYVTGAKLGRRSLKFKDYGIMAATFVNLETGRAVRIVSTEAAREAAHEYAPHLATKEAQQLEAYKRMPLKVLFDVYEVAVELAAQDRPGPSAFKTPCARCGAMIRDGREIHAQGEALCHYCAGQAYYRAPVRISVEQDE